MTNALLALAWASLTEEVIIRRITNQLLCKRSNMGERRGDIQEIREAVRTTRPPHGFLASRVRGVEKELPRQKKIRASRAFNHPVDWAKWCKPQHSRRLNRLYKRIVDDPMRRTCKDFTKVDGMGVFLASTYRFDSGRLVICRPNKEPIWIHADGETITDALIRLNRYSGAPICARNALLRGRRVRFDFQRLLTSVEMPNGSVREFPWKIETSESK